VLGVAFDARGRMYALENTTGNPFPTPETGRVCACTVGRVGNHCIGPHPSDGNDLRARWESVHLPRWLRSAYHRTRTSAQIEITDDELFSNGSKLTVAPLTCKRRVNGARSRFMNCLSNN